ncbi:Hypothetical predicted protein [Cloeon dipterum]|uniref:Uncharacterized protein n=1 Tax=Cloeon dipterum TaxID=197152 RepID=A0A8S1DY76_9INSE|nr:Hypothetical predicted protein [Cloeon dipterum]
MLPSNPSSVIKFIFSSKGKIHNRSLLRRVGVGITDSEQALSESRKRFAFMPENRQPSWRRRGSSHRSHLNPELNCCLISHSTTHHILILSFITDGH